MTTVEALPESTASAAAPPRLALIALGGHVTERVTKFASHLLDLGWEVYLVCIDDRRWREARIDPRLRVYGLMAVEEGRFVRRWERRLVYRWPGGAIAKARELVALSPVSRWLEAPLGLLASVHQFCAKVVHRRLFMPVVRHIRPLLLRRVGTRLLRWPRTERIDAIVAADLDSVPYACRLARWHPDAIAISALDTRLLVDRVKPG